VLIKVADKNGNSQLGDVFINFYRMLTLQLNLKELNLLDLRLAQSLEIKGGLGMLVALGMILLYVAFRFQYKFALGAVAALLMMW